jgi:uncharacterized membrane protein YbhN (UPF0104 family)
LAEPEKSKRTARWRAALRLVVLSAVGAGLVSWVAHQTHWPAFASRLAAINWGALGCGVLLFHLPWLWRGLRLWLLLEGLVTPGRAVAAQGMYEFLAWLLPAGTGQLSLPLVLGRYLGVQLTWGTKILLAVRLLDLVVLAATAAAACVLVPQIYPPVRLLTLPAAAAVVVGLGLLLWPHGAGGVLLRVWRRLGGSAPGRLGRFVAGVLTIKKAAEFRRRLPALGGLSALLALSRVMAIALLCRGLGAPLGLGHAAYLWSLTSLLNQVPVQPPGMAGVSDAINTGVFMSIGWSRQQAAEVVLGSRVVLTPVTLLLGLGAWGALAWWGRGRAKEAG